MMALPRNLAVLVVALLCSTQGPSVQAFIPSQTPRRTTKWVVPSTVVAPTAATRSYSFLSATVEKSPVTTSSSVQGSSLTQPKGSKHAWEVHKFGGASLADAELYKTVGDLLLKEAQGRGEGAIPTMAVVSAKAGMTDLLVKIVDSALLDMKQAEQALEEAVESQIAVLKELVSDRSITGPIEAAFRQDGRDILSVVQSLRMIQTVPAVTMEVVTGFGEIWSAQTLHAYLKTLGVPTAWIDARDILIVKGDISTGLGEKGSSASTGGVTPEWEITFDNLSNWWGNNHGLSSQDFSRQAPIVVVTGFVAKTSTGVPTTLKRSGSDYSATIFANLVDAGRVTMWKNTDGVYTADPRRVPEAFPIASLKYDEAMELAYFGAQVLHPSAMEPCIDKNIPVYVRNIFNPAFKGTVIQGRCPSLKESNDNYKPSEVKNWRTRGGEIPIKGITSVDKTALVTLEGASIGGANVAARFMRAMADNDISVLIITQASSESSITVAVPESQGRRALAALQDAFELELARSTINSLSLVNNMAIVAIVGEGMALRSGVSSTFMGSLARANVNIRLIAQGSSERQIAVVVDGHDASRALRAAHQAFTLSETTASLTILGSTGLVGRALVRQLQAQSETLSKEFESRICLNIATRKKKMVVSKDSRGINLENLATMMNDDEQGEPFDLEKLTDALAADVNPLRVIVDCTNSEDVADHYERWLSQGVHIVSPGRRLGAGDLDRYRRIRQLLKGNHVNLYLESSVGSALPIITTIRDLFETGDKIKKIQGSLSGTMAYVLSTFDENVPFSEAVSMAEKKGYTESYLCDDLSGLDVARKVVILARQIGMWVNIEDVEYESLISEDIGCHYDNRKVLEEIKVFDDAMLNRLKAAQEKDCALRYKFEIDKDQGTCKCSLEAVDRTDPLYRLKKNENLVAFETERYETSPLIVKGAAAGPDLAAAGVFADLLRLTRAYSKATN